MICEICSEEIKKGESIIITAKYLGENLWLPKEYYHELCHNRKLMHIERDKRQIKIRQVHCC